MANQRRPRGEKHFREDRSDRRSEPGPERTNLDPASSEKIYGLNRRWCGDKPGKWAVLILTKTNVLRDARAHHRKRRDKHPEPPTPAHVGER